MIWPKIGSNMFNGDTFLICDLCACWVYKDSSAWWCYDCYSMIGWSHQSGKALWQLVDSFERLPETSKWKKSNRIKSNEHHIIKQKRRSCRDSWSKHRQQFLGHARETHWEKSCETSAVCETSKVRILLKALELASKTWNQTQKFATISQLEFLQVLKRFVPCFAQKKPSQIWILLGSYLPLRRHWNHLFLSKMEVRTKVVWERCLHTTPQECVVVNICFSASGSEFLDLKQVAWWQREGQLGQFVLSFPALSLRWYQYVFSLGRWVLDNSVIHKIWTHTQRAIGVKQNLYMVRISLASFILTPKIWHLKSQGYTKLLSGDMSKENLHWVISWSSWKANQGPPSRAKRARSMRRAHSCAVDFQGFNKC